MAAASPPSGSGPAPPLQTTNLNAVPMGQHIPAETASLDKQRVGLILEINQILLEETMRLQAEGKGADAPSPGAQQGGESGGGEVGGKGKPSREYLEPLRRMQANLAYVASLAEKHGRPTTNAPPWPQIMTAPPGDERLAQMYAKLQGLFPQWKVQAQRMAAQQQQQQQAQQQQAQQHQHQQTQQHQHQHQQQQILQQQQQQAQAHAHAQAQAQSQGMGGMNPNHMGSGSGMQPGMAHPQQHYGRPQGMGMPPHMSQGGGMPPGMGHHMGGGNSMG